MPEWYPPAARPNPFGGATGLLIDEALLVIAELEH